MSESVYDTIREKVERMDGSDLVILNQILDVIEAHLSDPAASQEPVREDS